MIIYKVTNKINNKIYVGQTIKTLDHRKKNHAYEANRGSNFHFHKAIRFHGFDNFIWEVLEECSSIDELNKQEIMYIKQFETLKKGYNMTTGGGGISDFTHSQETRDKIAKANLGNTNALGRIFSHTDKSKELLRIAALGNTHRRGKKADIETRNKIALTIGGKPFYVIKDGKIVGKWVSQAMCAGDLSLNQSHISSCLLGSRKTHKGYTFERVEKKDA